MAHLQVSCTIQSRTRAKGSALQRSKACFVLDASRRPPWRKHSVKRCLGIIAGVDQTRPLDQCSVSDRFDRTLADSRPR